MIICRSFDGSDMRTRFWCWWFRGYNNAFRKDDNRDSKKSIGLGGNTQKSLEPLETFADGGGGHLTDVKKALGMTEASQRHATSL